MGEMPLRLYTDIREAMKNEDAVEAIDGAYIICVTVVDEWQMVTETMDMDITEPGYLLTAGYVNSMHVYTHFKKLDELAQYLAEGHINGVKEFIWRSVYNDED